MLAFAPFDAVVGVASAAVDTLATGLAPLAGPAATAVAIVVFTVAVRLLVTPLTVAQVRGERRRAALAPRIAELRRRYAEDPAGLQRELLDLYRSAGASPLAGCLPALLQAPFFLVMYRLFTIGEGDVLAGELAGVPLGHHLTDGLAGAAGPLFGVLLLVLLALAWLASRRMRRTMASAAALPDGAGGQPGAGVLARVMPLLPYGTLPVALVVPLAGVLYLVTTTAWTALEHTVLRRGR